MNMQVQVDIGFEKLVSIAKKLPRAQWNKLKLEVDKEEKATSKSDLETLLLKGPALSEEEIIVIQKNTRAINQWRTKNFLSEPKFSELKN